MGKKPLALCTSQPPNDHHLMPWVSATSGHRSRMSTNPLLSDRVKTSVHYEQRVVGIIRRKYVFW